MIKQNTGQPKNEKTDRFFHLRPLESHFYRFDQRPASAVRPNMLKKAPSLITVTKSPLVPINVLKLNNEAITAEKSRHYQYYNQSHMLRLQGASQDECIAYSKVRDLPMKKSESNQTFVDYLLQRRYPKDLAEPERTVSFRTGLKKTYMESISLKMDADNLDDKKRATEVSDSLKGCLDCSGKYCGILCLTKERRHISGPKHQNFLARKRFKE